MQQNSTLLRERRLELGLSQAELCRIADLHQSCASALERGYRKAGPKLQSRVSEAVEMEPGDLFDRRGFAILRREATQSA